MKPIAPFIAALPAVTDRELARTSSARTGRALENAVETAAQEAQQAKAQAAAPPR